MIAILRLEAIGDNYARSRVSFHGRLRNIGRIPQEQRAQALDPKRPWVAQLGFTLHDRVFLSGKRDYRQCHDGARGIGARGIYMEYVLDEGHVYEVHELLSWTETRRYHCRVVAGKVVEIDAIAAAALLRVAP